MRMIVVYVDEEQFYEYWHLIFKPIYEKSVYDNPDFRPLLQKLFSSRSYDRYMELTNQERSEYIVIGDYDADKINGKRYISIPIIKGTDRNMIVVTVMVEIYNVK